MEAVNTPSLWGTLVRARVYVFDLIVYEDAAG